MSYFVTVGFVILLVALVVALDEERRNVAAAIFSFSFHRLAKQISAKKLAAPCNLPRKGTDR